MDEIGLENWKKEMEQKLANAKAKSRNPFLDALEEVFADTKA